MAPISTLALRLATVAVLACPGTVLAKVAAADVQRTGDRLAITWTDPAAVDLYAINRPDAPLTPESRVLHDSHAGSTVIDHAGTARRYFVLVDTRDHTRVEVAERLIPLEQGSNFRDIGGYAAADGKRVRWGLIYRSGAQPMLTPADVATIRGLGITQLVDLRSDEERLVAPTRINGVPYTAVGYAMGDMMPAGKPLRNGADLYRNFPRFLAPQLKVVFADLLRNDAPIAYNCSAGQDRTGFVTAIVLSALGVPYDTIVADYHLSTQYRRPEYEMPEIDPALVAANPGLKMFAAYRSRPDWKVPQPLKEADGTPFLNGAFDEIHDKWGSVDAYLAQEIGVGPADLARLRARYLQ
jgi:protein-tyrosine phosphatase